MPKVYGTDAEPFDNATAVGDPPNPGRPAIDTAAIEHGWECWPFDETEGDPNDDSYRVRTGMVYTKGARTVAVEYDHEDDVVVAATKGRSATRSDTVLEWVQS